jgi:cysteinyl-tRNA synthetase
VASVRNVTDIDDKVLVNAGSRDWREYAKEVEQTFESAYAKLNILEPTHKPHATEHIEDMVALVEKLISLGHAYPALDGSANVFFDTLSWPNYGELTNQKLENMEGETDASHGRKSPNDFALFKAHKPQKPESAAWQTPWGLARPGWHIECSAMAKHFLGESFDIHGGGIDLRFPHHENELAQSTAAGDRFANFWLHNALVTIEGTKMSKSLGNGVAVEDLTNAGSWPAIRYWLASAQYRSNLDYSQTSISEAQVALDRIVGFLKRAAQASQEAVDFSKIPEAFRDAMNSDLNVPGALSVLHERVRAGNIAFDSNDYQNLSECVQEVRAMVQVLGLAFATEEPDVSDELKVKVEDLIARRQVAKVSKDFALADEIRAELEELGVTLKDMKDITMWSFNG